MFPLDIDGALNVEDVLFFEQFKINLKKRNYLLMTLGVKLLIKT